MAFGLACFAFAVVCGVRFVGVSFIRGKCVLFRAEVSVAVSCGFLCNRRGFFLPISPRSLPCSKLKP